MGIVSAFERFNEETGPGKHWWSNFRSRHPELTLRTADNLERSRANALTREVVVNYVERLENTLQQINSPRQLYNCDETFLPLNISCEKVVTRKNTKHRVCTTEHITLLCGASAAGVALPPMINVFLEVHIDLTVPMMQCTRKVSLVGLTANCSWRG